MPSDADALRFDADAPDLAGGVMLLAFSGWNDAGEAGSGAIRMLADRLGARRVARLAGDRFYDFQQVRPQVEIRDGLVAELTWPDITFSGVDDPPLLLAHGNEPQLRWRDLADRLVEVARRTGVTTVIFLGALLAEVPHTRPAPLIATASDAALRDRIGVRGADYSGPTGIVGAAALALAEAGLDVASLWASVSHYVPSTANPNAILSLVERVSQVCDLDLDLDELRDEVSDFRSQVDEAMSEHPDVAAYVRSLEEQVDAAAEPTATPAFDPDDLPTGEELAAELQRFLRETTGDEG